MKGFSIKTEIQEFDTFEQFAKEAGIGADDLVLCGEHTFDKYIAPLNTGVQTLFREKYGKGEPTDGMVDAILNKLRDKTYDRIIAVGGGTVIDIAKVVAVAGKDDTVDDLYDKVSSLLSLFLQHAEQAARLLIFQLLTVSAKALRWDLQTRQCLQTVQL